MIISDFQCKQSDNQTHVSALVRWEQAQRDPLRVFYEANGRLAQHAKPNPDGFLVAALLPAMRVGEERIRIEGTACPVLRDNLIVVADQMRSWYPAELSRIHIEASEWQTHDLPQAPHHASMFTGGIDSMCVVAENFQHYAEGDPRRIRDAILVQGFDIGGYHKDDDGTGFRRAKANAEKILEGSGVSLTTVTSNLIQMYFSVVFWSKVHHGAGCASVGHIVSPTLTNLHIGSTFDAYSIHPWGSHLATDPYCTSSGLAVHHDNSHFTRAQKVEYLANNTDWLENAIVCFFPEKALKQGALNCGTCEKCIRTRLELVAIGKGGVGSFASKELSAFDIRLVNVSSEFGAAALRELIPPLEARGEQNYANAIRGCLARWKRQRYYKKALAIPGVPQIVRISYPIRRSLMQRLFRK